MVAAYFIVKAVRWGRVKGVGKFAFLEKSAAEHGQSLGESIAVPGWVALVAAMSLRLHRCLVVRPNFLLVLCKKRCARKALFAALLLYFCTVLPP